MTELAWISVAAWLGVVVAGGLLRSRAYAIFRGVTLGLHTLILLPLVPYMGPFQPVALCFHAMVYIDSLCLIRPTLRPAWYRLLISWPAQFMAASTLLALPWTVAVAFGATPHGLFVPYLIGVFGMLQSLTARTEARDVVIGNVASFGAVSRVTREQQPEGRPLRIAQITDPHLGPFMSVGRLKGICQRVVDQKPDLIFLTGDFLTMESQAEARWLAEALSPLAAMPGKVFACLGNHDHEAPATVYGALDKAGARLLVDEAITLETEAGPVQILGFDFHFRARKEKMDAVVSTHPRIPGTPRLALLHDPGAFKHLAPGEVDLVFSGHTHGGQVGLLSLGLMWTMVGAVAKLPDHGLWGHGTSRLYVHRGTGHYGFPLRLGVPAEESVLSVYLMR